MTQELGLVSVMTWSGGMGVGRREAQEGGDVYI